MQLNLILPQMSISSKHSKLHQTSWRESEDSKLISPSILTYESWCKCEIDHCVIVKFYDDGLFEKNLYAIFSAAATFSAQEEGCKSWVYFPTCFPLSPGIFIFKQYYLWFCSTEIWDYWGYQVQQGDTAMRLLLCCEIKKIFCKKN